LPVWKTAIVVVFEILDLRDNGGSGESGGARQDVGPVRRVNVGRQRMAS
jgi:hypothetical protein